MPDRWTRREMGGRALVIRDPRLTLTHGADGYTLTGDDARTARAMPHSRTKMRLGAVLDWCGDHHIPLPTDADLAWLAT